MVKYRQRGTGNRDTRQSCVLVTVLGASTCCWTELGYAAPS